MTVGQVLQQTLGFQIILRLSRNTRVNIRGAAYFENRITTHFTDWQSQTVSLARLGADRDQESSISPERVIEEKQRLTTATSYRIHLRVARTMIAIVAQGERKCEMQKTRGRERERERADLI